MNKRDKRLVFVAVSYASFLAAYTGSAINVALPAIGAEFGMNHALLQYIVSAYVMMNAVLLVPFGRPQTSTAEGFFPLHRPHRRPLPRQSADELVVECLFERHPARHNRVPSCLVETP
jgi:hypothetical protein